MSNSQKLPPIESLTQLINSLINDRLSIEGKQLPCYVVDVDNQFVTVHFDMLPDNIVYPEIKIPILSWEYIRIPIQKGDKGVTLAADVSLRNVSKQGGVANRSILPSLTPLFFVPISNIVWSKEDDKKVVIVGPEGAIIKTKDGKNIITVDQGKIELKSSETIVTVNNNSATIKANDIYLNGKIHLNGPIVTDKGAEIDIQSDAKIKGIKFTEHAHQVQGIQTGGSTVVSKGPQ